MACFMDSGFPASAGMTWLGAGMTWVWRRDDVLYGFWVPACAGMT